MKTLKANLALPGIIAAMTFAAWLGAAAPAGASFQIVGAPGSLSKSGAVYLDAVNGASVYFSQAQGGADKGASVGWRLVTGFELAEASGPHVGEGLISFAVFLVLFIVVTFRGLFI